MDFVKRYWMYIRAHLEALNASQRWLIGALMVIMIMSLLLLMQYMSSTETVPITRFAASRTDEVLARLKSAGIEAEVAGGQIMVPRDQQHQALAMLVQDDMFSEDVAGAFNELISKQSPWLTDKQNETSFLIAKQDVLGKVIRKMKGVESANVVISLPKDLGFGKTFVNPSASVSIAMKGRGRIDKGMVEAVAGLVSGAVAEMPAQNVVVVDANYGRQHRVDDEDDAIPTEALELVRNQEEYHRKKIMELLQYIPGVIVAVKVQTDQVHKQVEESWAYEQTEPLASEESKEMNRRDVQEAGEPGPRSNTGLDIAGGTQIGSEEQTTESRSEFREKPLIERVHKMLTGHQVTQINVTINVPRGYFVQIYKANNPDEEEEPTDLDLQAVINEQLATIQDQVEPLISTETPGMVRVAMFPDETVLMASGLAGSGGGGIAGMMESQWAKPISVSLLALISLALMVGMVRKATKPESLPSVEELAGVPPNLPVEDELIGEAEQHDAAMAGVELNEDELRSRKIAEQIGDMIKANPNEAGMLLSKWVRIDD